MPQFPPSLNELMARGPVIGPINLIPSQPIVEQLCAAPFDFIWVDMEHGPHSVQDLGSAVSVCLGQGINPIVRVPCVDDWAAKWVLDQGVRGVIFPFVNTVEEAKQAVSACKYPPAGHRGYFPDMAARRWGLDNLAYVEKANEEICVILQIEHDDAVRRASQIAAVEGWDLLFIGPMDLSSSYGKLGKIDDPQVDRAIDTVLRVAKFAGKRAGILTVTPEDIKRRIDQGFDLIGVLPDIGIIGKAILDYWASIEKALR